MKPINFNNYQVYYMDNDGQKKIIAKNLSYSAAQKFAQQNTKLYNTDLEVEFKK